MRRQFTTRQDLINYLQSQFPQAEAQDFEPAEGAIVGGRQAAEQLLAQIRPLDYAQTRNFLTGAVTHLSAYIRHGVLSLAEVRDAVLAKVSDREDASRLIMELGWRDYWQRLYAQLGDLIWQDQEPYKTGLGAEEYQPDLPIDIVAASTGLACIDHFSHQLQTMGYLHNHTRMWLAAYIIHWRRVRWQAGATWFLTHLLDGDPASNNLSWQWVASTFSHKPYFFNRENLERYSNGVYCHKCPLYGQCDFEGSYQQLGDRLFAKGIFQEQPQHRSGSYGHRAGQSPPRRQSK